MKCHGHAWPWRDHVTSFTTISIHQLLPLLSPNLANISPKTSLHTAALPHNHDQMKSERLHLNPFHATGCCILASRWPQLHLQLPLWSPVHPVNLSWGHVTLTVTMSHCLLHCTSFIALLSSAALFRSTSDFTFYIHEALKVLPA